MRLPGWCDELLRLKAPVSVVVLPVLGIGSCLASPAALGHGGAQPGESASREIHGACGNRFSRQRNRLETPCPRFGHLNSGTCASGWTCLLWRRGGRLLHCDGRLRVVWLCWPGSFRLGPGRLRRRWNNLARRSVLGHVHGRPPIHCWMPNETNNPKLFAEKAYSFPACAATGAGAAPAGHQPD